MTDFISPCPFWRKRIIKKLRILVHSLYHKHFAVASQYFFFRKWIWNLWNSWHRDSPILHYMSSILCIQYITCPQLHLFWFMCTHVHLCTPILIYVHPFMCNYCALMYNYSYLCAPHSNASRMRFLCVVSWKTPFKKWKKSEI